MSLLETQNFLARLYTENKLRRNFLAEPEKVGRENGLSKTEIEELLDIFHEELEFFAESLFYKRLREVEKFLPLTKNVSGENFEKCFRAFADSYLPSGVQRHLEDAVEFCAFLQKSKSVSDVEKNTAKFEQAKLEFYGFEKRLVIRILQYDLKTKQKNRHLAVWFRLGRRHIIF